ncbi:hypothetical protein LC55x_4440 [Lysobacter capsici]|nr:hypothetical protein LC55x_4440 [Lysobacter capsici]
MPESLREIRDGRGALGGWCGSAHAVSPVVSKLNENPTPTARVGEIYRCGPVTSNLCEACRDVLRRNICACKRLNGGGFCIGRWAKFGVWDAYVRRSGDNCHLGGSGETGQDGVRWVWIRRRGLRRSYREAMRERGDHGAASRERR